MEDTESDSGLLAMVMMNSLTGGLTDPNKFDHDFNLLVPLALKDCEEDEKCEKKKSDLMVVLMAMQAGNPNSPMSTESILPILLMKDSSNNQNLLMFMTMGFGAPCKVPSPVIPSPVIPSLPYIPPQSPPPSVVFNEPEEITVVRTWRVDANGNKELLSETENNDPATFAVEN